MGGKKHSARPLEQWLEEPSQLSPEQAAVVASLEEALGARLGHRQRRLRHSLSVGRTAEALARHYGADPFKARVAGILHDWEKAVPDGDLEPVAEELGVAPKGPREAVRPLLHGRLAARTLPKEFPWLSDDVLQAIARHTSGSADMAPLDMVLFVADGIEPTRGPVPALEAQRDLVGTASLEDLYRRSFLDGVAYVVATERPLAPDTLDIYNALVLGRKEQEGGTGRQDGAGSSSL